VAAAAVGLASLGAAAGAAPLAPGASGQAPGATTTTTVSGQGVTGAPAQPDQSSTAPAVTLADQVTWLTDGASWTADVLIARPPAGATVQVAVHDDLRSRTEFEAAEAGELGDVEFATDPVPVDQLPTDAAGLRRVGFGPEAGLRQGVHPVAIRVLDAAGEPVAQLVTFVVTVPEETDGYVPLAVALVVDLGAPTALQPDGEITLSADSIARIDERVSLLEDAPRVPFTVAPVPETVEALASDTGSGLRLLDRLDAATDDRTVLARPFTDVDVSALMAADLVGEVNAHADAGADVIRTRLGTEPVGGTWEATGTVGADAGRQVAELGVGQALVDEEAVAEAAGLGDVRVTEVPMRFGEGGPEVMVADDALAAPLQGTDPVLDAQRFVAELAMAWFEMPAIGRAVVVRVPADAEMDPALVARALGELDEPAVVRPMTLPEVFAAVPPPEGEARPLATPAPHQPVADLRYLANPLREARTGAGGIGGVLEDDTAGLRLEHSLLIATGAATPNDERRDYVDLVDDQLDSLAQLVNAPPEFRITLTSRSGTIPLNITNDAGRQVRVRIELQSDQLEFPDGDEFEQVLQPGANRIDVRVRVLASGAFPLDIRIASPNGELELDTTRFDIRSTAVSGVGLVLSIGAVLFLALWWVRNWRATTRSKRLVPTDGPDPDGGSGPGPEQPDATALPPAPGGPPGGWAEPARHLRRDPGPTEPPAPSAPPTPVPSAPGMPDAAGPSETASAPGAPPWDAPAPRPSPTPGGARLTDPPPWARPAPPSSPPPVPPPAPVPPASAPGSASPFAPPGTPAPQWAPPVPPTGAPAAEGPADPEDDPYAPPPAYRPAHLPGERRRH
jgi:hypothetical protein